MARPPPRREGALDGVVTRTAYGAGAGADADGPAPSPALLQSCVGAVAALRARGKAGLVAADGLLFLLDEAFVAGLQAIGYSVLVRELDHRNKDRVVLE